MACDVVSTPQLSAYRGISFIICPVTSVELPLDTLLPVAMATEKRSVFLERAHLLDSVGLFRSEVFWCWKDDADRNRKWRDGISLLEIGI